MEILSEQILLVKTAGYRAEGKPKKLRVCCHDLSGSCAEHFIVPFMTGRPWQVCQYQETNDRKRCILR